MRGVLYPRSVTIIKRAAMCDSGIEKAYKDMQCISFFPNASASALILKKTAGIICIWWLVDL
jgi:hypothetical protein